MTVELTGPTETSARNAVSLRDSETPEPDVPMTGSVARAVEQIRRQFGGHTVEIVTDGNDGVFVTVQDVSPGPAYVEDSTWLGFHISSAYPHCDVYPHYTGPLTRRDGQAHGQGLSVAEWRGRLGVQISRRSNRWNPHVDTAAIKALKVLAWLASR